MYHLDTKKRNVVKTNKSYAEYRHSKPRNARIVFDGKYWFLKYAVKVEFEPLEEYGDPIGADLGLTNAIVTSDGKFLEPIWRNEKYESLIKRKKGLQRSLARKREQQKADGREDRSRNYWKTLRKLQVVERHIAELKKGYQIEIAKNVLSNNPSVLVLENLSVKEMLKNKRLSPRIHEIAWGT